MGQMSRGEFLDLAWQTVVAGVLAGCGVNRMPTPTLDRLPMERGGKVFPEINSFDKDKFSEPVVDHNLIPEIMGGDGIDKMNKSVAYLQRLSEALEGVEVEGNLPLSQFRINTSDNFPISIPYQTGVAGSDWRLAEVLHTMQTDIRNGKVKLEYDPSYDATIGTVNNFELITDTNGKHVLTRTGSTIVAYSSINKESRFYEDGNHFYRFITDLELAMLILHEYSHTLQGEMLAAFINADAGMMADLISGNTTIEKAVKEMEYLKNKEVSQAAGLVNEVVATHEAQANAVMLLGLRLLNNLNGGSHFPGSQRVDPSLTQMGLLRQVDPKVINLYAAFNDVVYAGHDATVKNWLVLARDVQL